MDGGMGYGGILRKSLRIGLDFKLGIRVQLPRKLRLEEEPSRARTRAGVLGRLLGIRVGRGYRKIGG